MKNVLITTKKSINRKKAILIKKSDPDLTPKQILMNEVILEYMRDKDLQQKCNFMDLINSITEEVVQDSLLAM